jgi:hypothetical protein
MPNRKTFDDGEKYDHSGHSTGNDEKGDLAPTPDAAAQRGPQSGQPPDKPAPQGSRSSSRDRATG